MKTEFKEWADGIGVTLVPETVQETAALLRYARNANSEKARVYFSFKRDPYCSICLDKRSPKVQKLSINPNLK